MMPMLVWSQSNASYQSTHNDHHVGCIIYAIQLRKTLPTDYDLYERIAINILFISLAEPGGLVDTL